MFFTTLCLHKLFDVYSIIVSFEVKVRARCQIKVSVVPKLNFWNRGCVSSFLWGLTESHRLHVAFRTVPHLANVCLSAFDSRRWQGTVFTCVLTSHSEPLSLSTPPLVSSCWRVYVMPTEPTTVRSDLNTYCKLVFSLTSAMTFTSTPPWRLVWISCLLSCIPCACVVVGFIYFCVYLLLEYLWRGITVFTCAGSCEAFSVCWVVCPPGLPKGRRDFNSRINLHPTL